MSFELAQALSYSMLIEIFVCCKVEERLIYIYIYIYIYIHNVKFDNVVVTSS